MLTKPENKSSRIPLRELPNPNGHVENDGRQKRGNLNDEEKPNLKSSKQNAKKNRKLRVKKNVIDDSIETPKQKRDYATVVDSEIKRCQANIEKGNSVVAFQEKMESLQKAKREYQDKLSQNPGMDWETILRVEALERLKTRLEEKDGDPCKELKNVVGIIAAYKSKVLKYDGLITYWCDGKLLQDPANFDLADVKKLNTERNRAGGGFWAEGLDFPGSVPKKVKTHITDPAGRGKPKDMVYFNVLCRLDHRLSQQDELNLPEEVEFSFMDDTGCSGISVFRDDILELMGEERQLRRYPLDHVMGYQHVEYANMTEDWEMAIAVQVTLVGRDHRRNVVKMCDWVSIFMSVINRDYMQDGKEGDRLCGGWTRNIFYSGGAPAEQSRIYFSDVKTGVTSKLPTVPLEQQKGIQPILPRPLRGAAWEEDKSEVHMNIFARGKTPNEVLEEMYEVEEPMGIDSPESEASIAFPYHDDSISPGPQGP